MNEEVQRIISGESQVRYGSTILAVVNYLRNGKESGTLVKTDKYSKREETARLRAFVEVQSLWVADVDLNNYVFEGVEQKVYLMMPYFILNETLCRGRKIFDL